jgi:hypothetical protein
MVSKDHHAQWKKEWRAKNPERERVIQQRSDAKRRLQQREKELKARVRRFRFKEYKVTVNVPVRTGTCSNCGSTGVKTHLHHDKYDDEDYLAHTRELCVPCHMALPKIQG